MRLNDTPRPIESEAADDSTSCDHRIDSKREQRILGEWRESLDQ